MTSKDRSLLLSLILALVVIAGVAGYLYIRNQHLQSYGLQGNPSIQPSAQTTTSIDKTAGWKTYSDSTLNASFKYPPNWTLVSGRQIDLNQHIWEIALIDSGYTDPSCRIGDCPSFGINFDVKPTTLSDLNSIIKKDYSSPNIIVSDTTLPNENFKKVTGTPGGAVYYLYGLNNSLVYIIYPYAGVNGVVDNLDIPKAKEDMAIFDKILSTFKFFDQNSTVPTVSTKTCGGWDSSGQIICKCSGNMVKQSCPVGSVCDSGSYFCNGICSGCCYKGVGVSPKYPSCP